jgi:hypothetical protein
MTEEETPTIKYRTKRIVENGKFRYLKIPLNPETELDEAKEEITRLKALIDTLRARVEELEQEQQRRQLQDQPSDTAESYHIYK